MAAYSSSKGIFDYDPTPADADSRSASIHSGVRPRRRTPITCRPRRPGIRRGLVGARAYARLVLRGIRRKGLLPPRGLCFSTRVGTKPGTRSSPRRCRFSRREAPEPSSVHLRAPNASPDIVCTACCTAGPYEGSTLSRPNASSTTTATPPPPVFIVQSLDRSRRPRARLGREPLPSWRSLLRKAVYHDVGESLTRTAGAPRPTA